MRKLLQSLISSALLLTVFSQLAFADFTDVSESHPNYDAITALQEADVLEGYEDGSFRPYLEVNRVEFLKIIIVGSDIPTDVDIQTPFNDVDEEEWYGPYLKKAYSEGWINGYGDGSFRPENTINKVEALKIIAFAQAWNLPDSIDEDPYNDVPANSWFAPYVVYAKDAGFIEDSSNLDPGALLSRGDISELIYQSRKDEIDALIGSSNEEEESEEESATNEEENEDIEEEEEEEEEEDIEEPDDEEESINFSPESYKDISEVFFEDIRLDQKIPNTYYKGEVYYIEGEISSGSYENVTVILDPDKSSQDTQYLRAETDGDSFSVPVYFTEQGNYNLGILPGTGGTSKAYAISVLPNIEDSTDEEEAPSAENNFDISYEDTQTFFEIDNQADQFLKVTFYQSDEKVHYYNRQGKEIVDIYYADFENFTEDRVYYYSELANLSSEAPLEISSDFAKSNSRSFMPTTHEFSDINYDSIEISLPETLDNPTSFSFTANLDNTYAAKTAYAIKPDGFVDEITLTSSSSEKTVNGNEVFGKNTNITYEYEPEDHGTYIIEINDEGGQAIVNTPLYIGSKIPLLPNFFDLNERSFFNGDIDVEDAREELLEYINEAREDHGLDPVEISDELNDLAQDHSDDMAENNFFGHINLDGETPNDRRLEAGINTGVSENIAKDVDIIFAHEGLMRSASHRQNILTPEWERVGLGIVEEYGYIYITEEFSTNAITSSDLDDMENELLNAINDRRNNEGENTLSHENNLIDVAEYINDKKINEGQSLTNSLFSEALSEYGISGSSQALGRSYNVWADIYDSLINDDNILYESNWNGIGIDVSTDYTGVIYTIVVVNDN